VLQFNATRSFLPRSTHEGDMMICDFWVTNRDKAPVRPELYLGLKAPAFCAQ
jgi:hypothetical protein